MYSLENSYSSDELIKWKERLVKVLNTENISYSCELKLDGVSISLSYKNGKLTQVLQEVMVIVVMMLLKMSKQLILSLWKHYKKLIMILILGVRLLLKKMIL